MPTLACLALHSDAAEQPTNLSKQPAATHKGWVPPQNGAVRLALVVQYSGAHPLQGGTHLGKVNQRERAAGRAMVAAANGGSPSAGLWYMAQPATLTA